MASVFLYSNTKQLNGLSTQCVTSVCLSAPCIINNIFITIIIIIIIIDGDHSNMMESDSMIIICNKDCDIVHMCLNIFRS